MRTVARKIAEWVDRLGAVWVEGQLAQVTARAGTGTAFLVLRDPAATAWKITNMRYQLDGGLVLPTSVARPCHVAVASCRRDGGALVVAPGFGPTARAAVG